MLGAFFKKSQNTILLGLVVAISIIAWYICFSSNLVLVYNDAMSHMNIPRLVVDNQQPGFAQLGSVWLPLNHILTLPLVWNNWAWQSGFAGSLVSMASYVVTVVTVFKIVWELTKKRLGAVVAATATALNVNFLYLQSTPLTEPLFVALFAGSVYYLIMCLKTLKVQYIIPLSILSAMQIMTRYDGWFVAACIAIILFANELWIRRASFQQAIGLVSLYAVPVAFACLVWFGWNAIIYGDPLYFATGPYSAKAQQEVIESSTGLASKGDIATATKTFGYTMAHNVGWIVFNTALIGWLLYLNPFNKKNSQLRLAVFAILASVVIFNIISLFLGFSIISVPEVNLNPHNNPASQLFNVRYGIVALPFAAAGLGFMAAKWRYLSIVALFVIVAQGMIMLQQKPITLQDGLVGSSAYRHHDVAQELHENIRPEDKVLISLNAEYMPVAFDSSLQMKQFVHEGVEKGWNEATKNPEASVEWILMSRDNKDDPVYKALVTQGESRFLDHYTLEFESNNGRLYRHNNTSRLHSLQY